MQPAFAPSPLGGAGGPPAGGAGSNRLNPDSNLGLNSNGDRVSTSRRGAAIAPSALPRSLYMQQAANAAAVAAGAAGAAAGAGGVGGAGGMGGAGGGRRVGVLNPDRGVLNPERGVLNPERGILNPAGLSSKSGPVPALGMEEAGAAASHARSGTIQSEVTPEIQDAGNGSSNGSGSGGGGRSSVAWPKSTLAGAGPVRVAPEDSPAGSSVPEPWVSGEEGGGGVAAALAARDGRSSGGAFPAHLDHRDGRSNEQALSPHLERATAGAAAAGGLYSPNTPYAPYNPQGAYGPAYGANRSYGPNGGHGSQRGTFAAPKLPRSTSSPGLPPTPVSGGSGGGGVTSWGGQTGVGGGWGAGGAAPWSGPVGISPPAALAAAPPRYRPSAPGSVFQNPAPPLVPPVAHFVATPPAAAWEGPAPGPGFSLDGRTSGRASQQPFLSGSSGQISHVPMSGGGVPPGGRMASWRDALGMPPVRDVNAPSGGGGGGGGGPRTYNNVMFSPSPEWGQGQGQGQGDLQARDSTALPGGAASSPEQGR